MTRCIATLIALCSATTIVSGGTPQQRSSSPRLAAARFALDSSWQIPRTDVVVLLDTAVGAVDGHPVYQSEQERRKETEDIARLIGPATKIGSSKDYLSCPGRGVCRAATNSYVLVVNGLFVGDTEVLIMLYTPASKNAGTETLTQALVALEQRGAADWAGLRYNLQPQVLVRRR